MAKLSFLCSQCGAKSAKWSGRCDNCGAWNTISEAGAPAGPGRKAASQGRVLPVTSLAEQQEEPKRFATRIGELDRVLGGGMVPGAAVLIGGDPGIGKSTLLMQAAAKIAQSGHRTLYVTGEESAGQLRLRAARLGLTSAPTGLIAATNLSDIIATIEAERPELVIIDSIQTMWHDGHDSAPGSVSQLRATAFELVGMAKRLDITVLMVGHVTKDGQIAGPRVIEHMVDTVLYFEGDRGHQFRILRSVKNRFGAADEIGVFEMAKEGLNEVTNPSSLFLQGRDRAGPGSAVFAGLEGTRPVLVEIQALVAPSSLAQPRRATVGLDAGRVAMVLAVLEARAGLGFGGLDVYLNVAGGLKITEPAADLAIAAALLSARFDEALGAEAVFFGEISLSGALRAVAQTENRLKEAHKLGFTAAILPADSKGAAKGLTRDDQADLAGFIKQRFSQAEAAE